MSKRSQNIFHKIYSDIPEKLRDRLFEFLLIFLAVFLGFWADRYREQLRDRERERQYILAMYEDLKSDITDFNLNLKKTEAAINSMHNIIVLLNSTSRDDSALNIYRYARSITYNAPFYQPNQRTYEQMKYAGDLRLIRNMAVSNSITRYYNSLAWILSQDNYIRERLGDYMGAAENIFDGASFLGILEGKSDLELLQTIPAGKYMTNDPMLFNKLYIRTQYFYGVCKVTAVAAKEALVKDKSLMQLLKDKYDIDNEE